MYFHQLRLAEGLELHLAFALERHSFLKGFSLLPSEFPQMEQQKCELAIWAKKMGESGFHEETRKKNFSSREKETENIKITFFRTFCFECCEFCRRKLGP